MTYSFDVFDTCLIRKCETISAFFDLLSLRVFDCAVDSTVRSEFVVKRKEAESRCDKNANATIEDIYANFSYEHPHIHPKSAIMEEELALEKEMLLPVYSMRQKIATLRASGHKIMFVSDMYLPSSFIKPILKDYGFFEEGDSFYVSCEAGRTKREGSLYELIHEKEKVSFRQWIHYGDNYRSDYLNAKRRGICARLVSHGRSRYASEWKEMGVADNCGVLLSALSKSLQLSDSLNERTFILTDIIAPFYASIAYRVLEDASEKGLTDLFFCARDMFHLYRMALHYKPFFSNIRLHYLRISREALYKGDYTRKMAYYVQEGLASKENLCAIVDMTSTGRTLKVLNDLFLENGYNSIYGYFIFKYDDGAPQMDVESYYCFFRQNLARYDSTYSNVFDHLTFIENFFSSNAEQRTTNYENVDGIISPTFSIDEGETSSMQPNAESWQQYYDRVLQKYVDDYILLGLHNYSETILRCFAFPTLCHFLMNPFREYVEAVKDFYIYRNGVFMPYVAKESLLRLIITKGRDTGWSRGTLTYNIPQPILSLLRYLISKKA